MMSSIVLDARAVLESGGYQTSSPKPDVSFFYFEDSNVLGVLHVLDNTATLLEGWEFLQDQFLRENGKQLAFGPLKAWNCYTVLLSIESPGNTEASALFAIEEDFRGTRKLVRAGLSTRVEIEQALAPLLPLRRVLALAPGDAKDRLSSRLSSSSAPLSAILTSMEAGTIAAALVDAQ